MGNEAIALGAIAAGVNLAAGYPGTPSTEVLETVAKQRPASVYVEWSVNEKAAMEVAAGAAYTGARVMVTMKQVGLNVASDPLMCVEYIGVKGGMVILVADDPGPISSQTEQDTRTFAMYSKLPCFDPASAQEAYEMIQDAFALSEANGTPVFLRPTTRVCHSYASVTIKSPEEYTRHTPDGFVKDSNRWVIFPRLANRRHGEIEARNERLAEELSDYSKNRILPGSCALGHHWPRIDSIVGRTDDMIKIKGVNVFPAQIEEILYEFPEVSSEYQIRISHLDGRDTMRLYVETSGSVNFQDLADRIAVRIKGRIGFTPLVKVVEIGLLPRSEKKTTRVIDERYR